ncbi:MAG: rhodanese-like domain-containing protein [Acidiferrobacterales bacterium]
MVRTITRNEIKQRLDNNDSMILVEALPEKYYRHTHLPGARHLPHDHVHELASEVLPNKDDFIVVYCANTPCKNSTEASSALVKLGYSNIAEYVEGKQDWIDAGLPTESGFRA